MAKKKRNVTCARYDKPIDETARKVIGCSILGSVLAIPVVGWIPVVVAVGGIVVAVRVVKSAAGWLDDGK